MLRLVSRADNLAVSLDEIKDHIRRTDTDEDNALLDRFIRAGQNWVENFTGLALVDQTWDYYFDEFPDGVDPYGRYIKIPKPPLLEIIGAFYTDGTEAEFSDYLIDYGCDKTCGRIYLSSTGTWPTTDGARNGGRIRFRAGHVDTGDSPAASGEIPEDIKAAICIYVANLYENRESIIIGTTALTIPWSAEELLRMYRVENSLA